MDDSIFFRRKSLRSYLPDPIPEEKLERLYEIIRWSPSGSNSQPWKFIFVFDPEQRERFAKSFARGNQWAAAAPVTIAVISRPTDDGVRDDDPVQYYAFNTALAVMSLLLGATDMGLLAHPFGGYDAKEVKAALAIPEDYHVLCLVALGYPGPIEQLDERTRAKDEAPRTRKPQSEIICFDRFAF